MSKLPEFVDICTNSTLLEDKILSSFPHPLFPDTQHKKIKRPKGNLFLISKLKREELFPYLDYIESELGRDDRYIVMDSENGDFMRAFENGNKITDQRETYDLFKKIIF